MKENLGQMRLIGLEKELLDISWTSQLQTNNPNSTTLNDLENVHT